LADRGDLKGLAYEAFMLGLAVLSIVNLVLMAVFEWESERWLLVLYVDAVLTVFFVGDFVYRLLTAPSKRHYMGRGGGLLDLVSCAPGLRILRVFRVVRAGRIFRRLGGIRVLGELRQQLAAGTVYLVVFTGILVLEVVGLLQLRFEEDAPGANITTAGDALWWGYVTATTVGYGDQFPVTVGGRIVGFLMLTVGVALFATFSGFLANTFLSAKESAPVPEGETDVQALLRDIERLQGEQQQAITALRALLDEPPSHRAAPV
jgi:voltage-gated potassium channel